MHKASYKRNENGAWEGVVLLDRKIVAECGHDHECRDYNHSTFYAHTGSAMDCARRMAWELNGRPEGPIPHECRGRTKRVRA